MRRGPPPPLATRGLARGVQVRLNTRVTRVDAGRIITDGPTGAGSVECGVCVWAAGTRARPIAERLLEGVEGGNSQVGPAAGGAEAEALDTARAGKVPVDAAAHAIIVTEIIRHNRRDHV